MEPTTSRPASAPAVAVLGGGCFWCLDAAFRDLDGVLSVESGYAGGRDANPTYEAVCTGRTGHAEVVRITFDPAVVSYRDLLTVFFTLHDPTTLNRQGNDVGTQYRSVIFYNGDEQKRIAEAYIAQLDAAKVFSNKIVTQVVPLKGFYTAEAYHQDYASNHPTDGYIMFNDAPKVSHLRKAFPELYTGK